ncbi:hypothetical protein HGQ98_00495 [Achromobacter ruhlandii]|uniref:Uncharacterized protein n=1 Tax=Achromobacter ruhlandii TaxID=72557 RepID=A0A848N766_9BURK|nr:hypothetical protein [Achromobacter ruhlandii]NMU88368.1 hypothetical protein [Achromobacter ruhlandii]
MASKTKAVTAGLTLEEARLCADNIDGWLDAGACEGGLEPAEREALIKLHTQLTAHLRRAQDQ